MIVSNDGGVTVSLDGGKTWTSELNQPTAQFYHVITDNRSPYYVYGAQQDNSTIAIASRSDNGTHRSLGLVSRRRRARPDTSRLIRPIRTSFTPATIRARLRVSTSAPDS